MYSFKDVNETELRVHMKKGLYRVFLNTDEVDKYIISWDSAFKVRVKKKIKKISYLCMHVFPTGFSQLVKWNCMRSYLKLSIYNIQ